MRKHTASYTRRSLIKRGGLAGTALWLVSTGWDRTIGRAVAAVLPDRTERSRRTYVALVDAATSSPKCRIPGGSSADLTARFEGWYSEQDPRLQRIFDSTMDDIDGSFERGPFHRASRGQRLGHIRALAHPPIPATTGPSSEWRHGAWREEQIKRYAADPAHNSDPTDISTAKPAPLDTSQPPAVYPTVSDDLVMRATMMSTALRLAAAPGLIDPSDPDDLTKVPPVEV